MKILTSLLILFSFHFVIAQDCIQNRGSLDIGSGTTKGLVAEVNICDKKIVKIIFEDRLPLSFNEALEKSKDQTLPKATIEDAVPKMKSLIAKMQEFKPASIRAVATSVFRVAKNGSEAAKELSKGIAVPISVISQDKEAELGYLSALAASQTDTAKENKKVIVWDIGGGSMQMYTKDKIAKIYKGNLASVTFKNKVLTILKFQDINTNGSPNPLGQNKESAIQLAKNHAYLNVPDYFKQNAEKAKWLGVGGVLSESIQNQINKENKEFTQTQLEETLSRQSKLSDEQLTGAYKTTDVTNLALVLGYMKALKIEKIETVKASLGQGIIQEDLNNLKTQKK